MSNNFKYRWYIKDGYPAKEIYKHNLKVFGTFICGGGSAFGYKLAGYDHLGGIEIDKQIAPIYKKNHNPKYLFVEDIRTFRKRQDLPSELFDLDILDGSPPCSVFSTVGKRESGWGVKKTFREGQSKQSLDDLFFEYIELAKRLKPKIVIAENVKGILMGNAKIYCKKIKEAFIEAGYEVQLFLLNAATMGVPQKRERVFFIARRKDLKLPELKLNFNKKPILFKELEKGIGKLLSKDTLFYKRWLKRIKSDKNFCDICTRTENNKRTNFSIKIIHEEQVPYTIVASGDYIKYDKPEYLAENELCQIGSYPLDYNFENLQSKYLIGMSVPPVMMAQLSYQIYLQLFKNI